MTEIVATLKLIKIIVSSNRHLTYLHRSKQTVMQNFEVQSCAISFNLLGSQWRFLRWWQPQQGLQAHSFAYLWSHDAVRALAPEVKAR